MPAFVGDFLPPFSVRKLQLFIELAKIDLSMLNESELDEHFKLMKQLEKIRIYQAHLVKRRRKMATLRLLHVLEQEPDYRICDPNVLDERLRHKELLDKGLYKRESYYCDGEPTDYVCITESKNYCQQILHIISSNRRTSCTNVWMQSPTSMDTINLWTVLSATKC